MHELFENILSQRDLSRAGELFSNDDDDIVDDLTSVVNITPTLVSCFTLNGFFHHYFSYSKFPQSFLSHVIWKLQMTNIVIGICVNRCTSCIRETDTAER